MLSVLFITDIFRIAMMLSLCVTISATLTSPLESSLLLLLLLLSLSCFWWLTQNVMMIVNTINHRLMHLLYILFDLLINSSVNVEKNCLKFLPFFYFTFILTKASTLLVITFDCFCLFVSIKRWNQLSFANVLIKKEKGTKMFIYLSLCYIYLFCQISLRKILSFLFSLFLFCQFIT